MKMTYQEAHREFHTRRAKRAQLKAITEALGDDGYGWRGFYASTDVLNYLRSEVPGYENVNTVTELCEKLGLDLSGIYMLDEARAAEVAEDLRLDEVMAKHHEEILKEEKEILAKEALLRESNN